MRRLIKTKRLFHQGKSRVSVYKKIDVAKLSLYKFVSKVMDLATSREKLRNVKLHPKRNCPKNLMPFEEREDMIGTNLLGLKK